MLLIDDFDDIEAEARDDACLLDGWCASGFNRQARRGQYPPEGMARNGLHMIDQQGGACLALYLGSWGRAVNLDGSSRYASQAAKKARQFLSSWRKMSFETLRGRAV